MNTVLQLTKMVYYQASCTLFNLVVVIIWTINKFSLYYDILLLKWNTIYHSQEEIKGWISWFYLSSATFTSRLPLMRWLFKNAPTTWLSNDNDGDPFSFLQFIIYLTFLIYDKRRQLVTKNNFVTPYSGLFFKCLIIKAAVYFAPQLRVCLIG